MQNFALSAFRRKNVADPGLSYRAGTHKAICPGGFKCKHQGPVSSNVSIKGHKSPNQPWIKAGSQQNGQGMGIHSTKTPTNLNGKVCFSPEKQDCTWKIPHHSSKGHGDPVNLVAWVIKGNCKFSLRSPHPRAFPTAETHVKVEQAPRKACCLL